MSITHHGPMVLGITVGDARKLNTFAGRKVNTAVESSLLCVGGEGDARQGLKFSSSEPITRSFEGEDFGVVDDAIDHRCGDAYAMASPQVRRNLNQSMFEEIAVEVDGSIVHAPMQ